MTLPELLDAIRLHDIKLELKLMVKPPPGGLTDELRHAFKEHKPHLLAKLGRDAQWEALSRQRWGPALNEPTPGTVKPQGRLRSPLKWHGGKSYLSARIRALFPHHETYVEPFAGGLSVLLNKSPVQTEVAGDLNGELIQFYTTLRDRPKELTERLRSIPYRQESFEWACGATEATDPLESAVRFLVRNRMSRGGLGKDFAWSNRLRGGQPGDVNAWQTILAALPAIASRLRDVELFCKDALTLIRRYDSPNTLFYCDPPYVHGTRTARNVYTHEMSDEDHARLVDVLADVQGAVILSGYANPLYEDRLRSWKRHEFEMPNHSGQGKAKGRRVEVLWIKTACGKQKPTIRSEGDPLSTDGADTYATCDWPSLAQFDLEPVDPETFPSFETLVGPEDLRLAMEANQPYVASPANGAQNPKTRKKGTSKTSRKPSDSSQVLFLQERDTDDFCDKRTNDFQSLGG